MKKLFFILSLLYGCFVCFSVVRPSSFDSHSSVWQQRDSLSRTNADGSITTIATVDGRPLEEYSYAVIAPEWGDNGVNVFDEDRVGEYSLYTRAFSVRPHTSRTIALWALKNHYDELFEDGVICFTILDSAVVKHFTSAEIAAGKLYLARYFITLDQLPEYMPEKNLLSITYPSVDGKDPE